MDIDDACYRCGSRMLTSFDDDDDSMYCIVCGAHGGIPYSPNNIQGTRTNKTSGSTRHTARYKAVLQKVTTDEAYYNKDLKHLIVRYRLTYSHRAISVMPALIMECPWCGGVTTSQTWKLNRKEYSMYIECPSQHSYSMICNADGDYYWR